MQNGGKTIVYPRQVSAAQAEILIAHVDLPLFKAFLAHKEPFEIMLKSEVFDLQHGKAILNFHEGRVQNIVIERRTYQHQTPRGFA